MKRPGAASVKPVVPKNTGLYPPPADSKATPSDSRGLSVPRGTFGWLGMSEDDIIVAGRADDQADAVRFATSRWPVVVPASPFGSRVEDRLPLTIAEAKAMFGTLFEPPAREPDPAPKSAPAPIARVAGKRRYDL